MLEETESGCKIKNKSRLMRILCDSGFDEPIYDTFRTEIAEQNGRNVEITSFIGSIIMLGLTFASVFVPSISKVRSFYFLIAMMFVVIFIVARFFRPKNTRGIVLCNYGFLVTAFIFAMGLDIIQKSVTATTICVLLVALPLLVVDRPYRELLFFLVISICFMLESVFIKQSPKASIDVVNGISFLGVGAFLGYKHNQMVLRNIRGLWMLQKQRDTDALTNLYNKNAFENLARAYVEQYVEPAGLMIVDMDNFKYVNDTYGHQAGDEILAKVGKLLSSQFRATDYVCRFGGDEFVAFIPKIVEKADLRAKADTILAGVDQLRIEADENYRAHLCMGIARYPEDGKGFEELFRNADDAMYHVKKHGKNGYGFYDESFRTLILVVDDIELNRVVLKKILSTEYEILEASDGKSALGILEAHPTIQMIITDIQMPGMDGIELIRQVRAQEQYKDIAIIAETQYGDHKQEAEIISLGADDFVYKAASARVIQKRIRNVLDAKKV